MPVLAYHFIFSAYGFWLPNDPRGSWSTTIRNHELLRFGPATKVQATRSVAHAPHDVALRREAKRALKYSPVRFTGIQARAIVRGFAGAAREGEYELLALAILPDHAHLVMARHPRRVESIASHLKAKATRQLSREGAHPLSPWTSGVGPTPSPWARNYWCPFIRDETYLNAAIRYVERNPIRCGLKRQHWQCVVPAGPSGLEAVGRG